MGLQSEPLNDEQIATKFIPAKMQESWFEKIDVEGLGVLVIEKKLNNFLSKLPNPMKLKFHSFNDEGQALWNVWMI